MPAKKSPPSRMAKLFAAVFTSIVAPVVVNCSVHKLNDESARGAAPPAPVAAEAAQLGPPRPQAAVPDPERLVWRPAR